MKANGTRFVPGQVTEWLDCGNKDATVYTNQRYLEYLKERGESLVAESAIITNSVLLEPVYIGENAVITNSVVGPHVSLGAHANVRDSRLSNSIVQQSATVLNAVITNSMIGNFATVTGTSYSTVVMSAPSRFMRASERLARELLERLDVARAGAVDHLGGQRWRRGADCCGRQACQAVSPGGRGRSGSGAPPAPCRWRCHRKRLK